MKATKKTMKPKMAKGGKMIKTAGNALTKALLGQGYNERPAKMQKGGEMGEKMNKYMNLSVNLTVTKDKTEPKETESESKMKKGGKMMAKGGKMSKFDKLASSVAKSYMKKGKSATAANKIGAAVAAKVGMAKFGKKKMTAMAVKGKKKK
jgi:hypothetical protein